MKRSKPNKARKKPGALGPTPERLQHGNVIQVSTELAGIKAHRVQIRDNVDLLHSHGKLSRDEFNACEHFRSMYRSAYGADCQIARYDKGISGGPGVGQQQAYVAMQGLARKLGMDFTALVVVIIDGATIRQLARRLTCRNGDALPRFKLAIKAMTDFWGMPNEQ